METKEKDLLEEEQTMAEETPAEELSKSPSEDSAELEEEMEEVSEDEPQEESVLGEVATEEDPYDENSLPEAVEEKPQKKDANQFRRKSSRRRRKSSRERTLTPLQEGKRITIRGEDKYKSLSSKEDEATLEIRASLDKRTNKILTGKVSQVKKRGNGENAKYIVIIVYKQYSVYIPAERFLPDYNEIDLKTVRTRLSNRLFSECDFIVTQALSNFKKEKIVAGDRLLAMEKKKQYFWFRESTALDKDGNHLKYLRQGKIAQARVVTVVGNGVFVELLGVEGFIPRTELSYNSFEDISEVCQTGDEIDILLMEVERDEKTREVSFRASKKRAELDTVLSGFDKIEHGLILAGEVTGDFYNDEMLFFFVKTDYIDMMCKLGDNPAKLPRKGSRVQVVVEGKDEEARRVWGRITRVF